MSRSQVADGWLSPVMVAAVCGMSATTVRKCCDTGDLKCVYVPGSRERRVNRKAVEAWAKRHGVPLDWDQLTEVAR